MNLAVGARELKNRLGTYLRRVRQGEVILVTEHGRPVAELRPIASGETGVQAQLAELARGGLLTLPKSRALAPFQPRRVQGKLASTLLVAEREDRF
ncbi:MAG TPA: type II toxin-antitoxin system prevent-host-death family antitoxin [Thermoanaerobaculia bacterium]|nr:type II toxin-antitoxin system prevent-host-death family antitoxin [Thermoanaerobaculia bacterium]